MLLQQSVISYTGCQLNRGLNTSCALLFECRDYIWAAWNTSERCGIHMSAVKYIWAPWNTSERREIHQVIIRILILWALQKFKFYLFASVYIIRRHLCDMLSTSGDIYATRHQHLATSMRHVINIRRHLCDMSSTSGDVYATCHQHPATSMWHVINIRRLLCDMQSTYGDIYATCHQHPATSIGHVINIRSLWPSFTATSVVAPAHKDQQKLLAPVALWCSGHPYGTHQSATVHFRYGDITVPLFTSVTVTSQCHCPLPLRWHQSATVHFRYGDIKIPLSTSVTVTSQCHCSLPLRWHESATVHFRYGDIKVPSYLIIFHFQHEPEPAYVIALAFRFTPTYICTRLRNYLIEYTLIWIFIRN